MKHTIKFFLLLILFVSFTLGQKNNGTNSFIFPENSIEFTIQFPSKPKIEKIFAIGKSGLKAELLTNYGFLRAEIFTITQEEAKQVFTNDDSHFIQIGFDYAEFNGLTNSTSTTGKTKLGRFINVKGFKKVDGINISFEAIFYYGQQQAIILYAGAKSSEYPRISITNFFSSLNVVKDEEKFSIEELDAAVELLSQKKKTDIWLFFAKDDKSKYFYNPSKITHRISFVKGWVENRDGIDNEVIAKILYEVDCKNEKIRSLAGVGYFTFSEYPDGRIEKSKSSPRSWDNPKSSFRVIIPDSIGEAIHKKFCSIK